MAASGETTAAALQRYSAFVEEVLRPQLTQTLAKRDALTTEMNEYQELLELVRELLAQRLKSTAEATSRAPGKPAPLHVLMDLGHKFRVRAKVSDPSLITVDVGLNFHVEMTLEEAQAFVSGHLVHLARKRDEWQQKARQVSDHVNVVIESIQKLVALQQ
ncbi:hypothetical protein PybrP1_011588 [[Pythium] brassicae (nom. inval.)]|nr:hypothetical protein PybrP1_011588 [[Pythium] brassicae (nom. inval.)]